MRKGYIVWVEEQPHWVFTMKPGGLVLYGKVVNAGNYFPALMALIHAALLHQ